MTQMFFFNEIQPMNPTNYTALVRNLRKPRQEVLDELTPEQADLWHMGTLLITEAGELLDAIKKHVIYQKPLDFDNVVEELGDLEFSLEGIRQILSITREMTLEHNHEKLYTRYNEGSYSNTAAQQRADKTGTE